MQQLCDNLISVSLLHTTIFNSKLLKLYLKFKFTPYPLSMCLQGLVHI